jgi:hypothetical protein
VLLGVKTAISIPNEIFAEAERLAKQLGISRSELFREALGVYLRNRSQEGVTEALNSVYGSGGNGSPIDPALTKMQASSLGSEKW